MTPDFEKMARNYKDLPLEEALARAYQAGYGEQVGSFGSIVVQIPQPPWIWVLVCKENGKRKVAFSFDGPPSPAYVKMGKV